jgi:hypothetical protein
VDYNLNAHTTTLFAHRDFGVVAPFEVWMSVCVFAVLAFPCAQITALAMRREDPMLKESY